MSQRPPASRPASRSPPDQRISLPPVQLRDDANQGGRPVGERPQPEHDTQGYAPIQPSPRPNSTQIGTTGEEWRSQQRRELGVHSILNPTEPGNTPSSRHVSGGYPTSPSSANANPAQIALSSAGGGIAMFLGQPGAASPSPIDVQGGPFSRGHCPPSPRRILTPKSRSLSIGRAGAATIDAQRSPFLPSRGRGYAAVPGQPGPSEIPPMPTQPGNPQQQHYGYPPLDTSSRQASMSAMQAPPRAPQSQNTSPSMSAASLNPSSSQASPVSYSYQGGPPPPTGGTYYPGSSFAPAMQQGQQGGGGSQFQAPSALGTEGPYSAPPPSTPASTNAVSRQSSDSIQVLTFTTAQGIYNVPVDVHQASRLADEKRARNAGASARFRQRRKEKEKEASTTIEKMQQQTRELERKVRDTEQERDFYRNERDRLRDVMYRTPETRHLAMQGPPSPQALRATSGSYEAPMGQGAGAPPPSMSLQGPGSSPERPTRRRRTGPSGEYSHVPYNPSATPTLPPVQAPGYRGQTANLPPLRIDSGGPVQATRPEHTPTTITGAPPSFDAYSRGSYDRGWPSEGNRR